MGNCQIKQYDTQNHQLIIYKPCEKSQFKPYTQSNKCHINDNIYKDNKHEIECDENINKDNKYMEYNDNHHNQTIIKNNTDYNTLILTTPKTNKTQIIFGTPSQLHTDDIRYTLNTHNNHSIHHNENNGDNDGDPSTKHIILRNQSGGFSLNETNNTKNRSNEPKIKKNDILKPVSDKTSIPNNMIRQQSYNNLNLMDIKKILSPEILNIQDINQTIYEGPLLKYKPGTNFNWIERWCIVNKIEFKYYKNQLSAYCWDNKPLYSILIKDIMGIYRVILDLPQLQSSQNPQNLQKQQRITPKVKKDKKIEENFQFEIFTMDKHFPDIDYESNNNDAKGNNDEINLNQIKDLQNCIDKDHLMRPPPNRENKVILNGSDKLYYPNQEENQDKDKKDHKQNKIPISSAKVKVTLIICTTLGSLIIDRSSKVLNEEKLNKISYHWVKKKSDLISWTGREKEWYLSEKRLLFSTSSLEEREKWLSILNWILSKISSTDNNYQYTSQNLEFKINLQLIIIVQSNLLSHNNSLSRTLLLNHINLIYQIYYQLPQKSYCLWHFIIVCIWPFLYIYQLCNRF